MYVCVCVRMCMHVCVLPGAIAGTIYAMGLKRRHEVGCNDGHAVLSPCNPVQPAGIVGI